MNEPLDARSVELLRRLMVGDVKVEDPEVVRRTQEDPAFAARRRELVGLAEALDEEGRALETLVQESRDAVTDQDRAVVRRAVRAMPLPPAVAWFHRPPLWMAAAGLAIFLTWWAAQRLSTTADRERVPLGPEAVTCVAPEGPVDAFDQFHWRSTERGPFTVSVLSDEPGDEGRLLLEREAAASPLLLEESVTASWPDRILWRVRVHAPDGETLAVDSARARRDSR